MESRRQVESIWRAAVEVGIDLTNARNIELLERDWLTIPECCELIEQPIGYRSGLHKAIYYTKTLTARITPRGDKPLVDVTPRHFLEYLLNRHERYQEEDRRRLKRLKEERDKAKDG